MLRVYLYLFLTLYLRVSLYAEEIHKYQQKENIPFRAYSEKLAEDEKPYYFISHLGCKKINGDQEVWDTDKYLWEIGKDLQNKKYTLESFINGIDRIFEKSYKFKNDLTEVVFWNRDKKPANSDDLNVYKKEREEFKIILKDILKPFEEEGKKYHISPLPPEEYRKSYLKYKTKIYKLNQWKDKYPKKIKNLCPLNPDNPENAFINYEKDALSSRLEDNQHPPLDVLAYHVAQSIGCDDKDWKTPPLTLWYVGDRIKSGEFTHEEWRSAFQKELDESVKRKEIKQVNRNEYEIRFNNLLENFEKDKQNLNIPLNKGAISSQEDTLIQKYSNIRSEDIKLQQWVRSKKILHDEKFPCDPDKVIKGRGIIDQIHYGVDPPLQGKEKNISLNSCHAIKKNLERKYEEKFKDLKDQIETAFFGSEINLYPEENSDSIRKEKEDINKFIKETTEALKGKDLEQSDKVAQKYSTKHSSKLNPIWEPRLRNVLLQTHIDEIVSFWTEKFILNDKSPDSPEGKKSLNNFIENLSKATHTKFVLSCYESNGRVYFHSSHGKEKQSTTYVRPKEDDIRDDLKEIQKIFKERQEKQKKDFSGHHFDKQTNWGTSQISFDQSHISSPSGRYYHGVISNMIYAKAKNSKSPEVTQLALKKITSDCKLKSFLSGSSEEDIKKISNEILKRMRNTFQNKNNYAPTTSAIEDFAFIQQFCLPLHSNLALKVYQNSGSKYFGSINNEKRKDACKDVGDIDRGTNTILKDLNSYVLQVLKTNYEKATSSNSMGSPEDIKKMKKTYADLDQKEKEIEKNQGILEGIKSDSRITAYLKRLQESSLHEAWKLFAIEKEKPLLGWMGNETADTSLNIQKSFKDYIQSDEINFQKNKADFLIAQKERRKSSLSQINQWIHETKSKFDSQHSKKIDETFFHLKDRLEALHDLYDVFEKELSDQIKLCKIETKNNEAIYQMIPIYKNPDIKVEEKKPFFKPKKN